MPALSAPISALLIAVAFLSETASAADRSLVIVEAGVQDSEDRPFVPSDYQFLPGEYVYSTFKIAGFTIKSEDRGAVERISLAYEVTAEDSKGVALAPPASGSIETELNPEDKNWMPVRRTSFLIPSYIAAGEFRIHIAVKDLFGQTETSKDLPFPIGGTVVRPTDKIAVQNFRFLRQENDRTPLEVAAFRPGDTVHISFELVGYKLGPQNQYRLAYSVTVLRPDGKPFLAQPETGELTANTFYPAQFVPANFNVTTSGDSSRGEYILLLTIRDLIGNQSCQTRQAFSIE